MKKIKNTVLIFLSMCLVLLTSCNGETANIKQFSAPKNERYCSWVQSRKTAHTAFCGIRRPPV